YLLLKQKFKNITEKKLELILFFLEYNEIVEADYYIHEGKYEAVSYSLTPTYFLNKRKNKKILDFTNTIKEFSLKIKKKNINKILKILKEHNEASFVEIKKFFADDNKLKWEDLFLNLLYLSKNNFIKKDYYNDNGYSIEVYKLKI
ncbi:MAG: hypothetical protein ACP5H7_02680, partial [Minisyncoccia bacterium]